MKNRILKGLLLGSMALFATDGCVFGGGLQRRARGGNPVDASGTKTATSGQQRLEVVPTTGMIPSAETSAGGPSSTQVVNMPQQPANNQTQATLGQGFASFSRREEILRRREKLSTSSETDNTSAQTLNSIPTETIDSKNKCLTLCNLLEKDMKEVQTVINSISDTSQKGKLSGFIENTGALITLLCEGVEPPKK